MAHLGDRVVHGLGRDLGGGAHPGAVDTSTHGSRLRYDRANPDAYRGYDPAGQKGRDSSALRRSCGAGPALKWGVLCR